MTVEERYNQFQSELAPLIIDFVKEKKSLGFKYESTMAILLRFDSYCCEKSLENRIITKDFLDDWMKQSDGEGVDGHKSRMSAVRQFLLYMASLGYTVYIPRGFSARKITLPHIFTMEEEQELFKVIDDYSPRSDTKYKKRMAKEYKVLFRLYAGTGVRNQEGCGIATKNVNLRDGVLMIIDAKGQKDRLVYMSQDLTVLCRNYYDWLCKELGCIPEWFFPGKYPDKPIRNTSVDRVLASFWSMTSFAAQCSNKPTVHDFRFSFVTHKFDEWERKGAEIEGMMPYLSAYLGHKSVSDTYYYHHLYVEALKQIKQKDRVSDDVIPEVRKYGQKEYS